MAVRIVLLALLAPLAAAQQAELDWYGLERRVVAQLLERDVGAWARELAKTPLPAGLEERLFRLQVASRAGHAKEVRRILDALSGAAPDVQSRVLSKMGDFLIDREDWELTRYAFERLPHMTPGWRYVFVRHWEWQGDHAGLDRWLAERMKENPGWLFERLKFRARQGTAQPLLDELAADVRAHPADHDRLFHYVAALVHVDAKPDLMWLPGVVRPAGAYGCYRIASKLLPRWPRVARAYLLRSLERPLLQEGKAEIERSIAMTLMEDGDPPTPERLLRGWTKRQLMQVHLKLGEAKRAQVLLEELAAAYPDGVPHDMLEVAGQIQRGSGARVIEGRVRKARKDESRYWLERGAYFTGRNEAAEAAAAWKEALRFARKEGGHALVTARDAYVHWLSRTRGDPAVLDFVRGEFDNVEPGGEEAAHIVGMLLRSPNDSEFPRFWKFLAARAQWDHFEEDVIEGMAMRVKGWDRMRATPTKEARASRAALWTKAETLTKKTHPSRAATLGWVMTRYGASARSIPLLEDAIRRFPAGEARARVHFTLFEAHLRSGGWRQARAVWPAARRRLGPREYPEWLGGIALCAARAGAREAALDAWAVRANVDRIELDGLDDMVEAGLRDELIAFYEALAKSDPRSVAPARALRRLRAQR